MTITEKVAVYFVSLTVFLLWETMVIAQMFRAVIGGYSLYAVLALFGLGCFLYIVRFVRHEPIKKED